MITAIISRIIDTLMAIPFILLAISIVGMVGISGDDSLLVIFIVISIYLFVKLQSNELFILLTIMALIIAILLILPIGGADMPVVVSLLNSLSGIAAAFTGFVIGNNVLII